MYLLTTSVRQGARHPRRVDAPQKRYAKRDNTTHENVLFVAALTLFRVLKNKAGDTLLQHIGPEVSDSVISHVLVFTGARAQPYSRAQSDS